MRLAEWIDTVRADAVVAWRQYRRAPVFTAGIVLTIAIAIGGSTAIFGLVNATILRPLPFADGDRVVRIRQTVTRP